MKNKKAKILLICGIFVVLVAGILASIFIVANNRLGGNDLPTDSNVSADHNPFLEDTGYAKSEVVLDGVLDDKQWEGLKSVSYNEKTTTTVKGFYGENGIYIGAIIEDKMLWGHNGPVVENSSFEMYIDPTGEGGEKTGSQHLQLYIDVKEQSSSNTDLVKSYAVKIDGTMNDDVEDKGYTMEIFIPYSQLGDNSDINYGITFGTVGCNKEGVRESWCGISGVNPHCPDTYYTFYRDTNEIAKPRKVNYAKYKVDGKDTDKIWQGRKTLTFGDFGRAKVSNYFAEEGLYFFFEMQDDKVCAEGTTVWLNDSVEIYLDSLSNGGETPQADDIQVRADVLGNIEVVKGNGTGWEARRDNVFSGVQKKDDGYNLEVFIPWSDLGMEKAPASMGVSFGSPDWDGEFDAEGNKARTWSGIGTNPHVPNTYVKMTKNYIDFQETMGMLVVKTPKAPAAEVTLDGVLDEKLWDDAQIFLYSGMSVRMQYVWTDRGCYMGFDVSDDNVEIDNNFVFSNSSVEIYLDYLNNKGTPDDNDRTIFIDASSKMLLRRGVEGVYTDFKGSAIQSKAMITDTGYTIELYIPWAEFGGGRPEKMGIAFGHVLKFKTPEGTVQHRWFGDGLCPDPQKPSLYSEFTSTNIVDVTN